MTGSGGRISTWWVTAFVTVVVPASASAQNTTTRVSVATAGTQATNISRLPAISADGRYVAFESEAANLVPGDTNGFTDVFVHDRQAGTTERVSLGPKGLQGNHISTHPSISADGRYVAFASHATTLVPGDTNGRQDVFVHDRHSGTTKRVSMSTWGIQLPGGNQTDGHSRTATISRDGRFVVFQSGATNLVPDDTNGQFNVFRVDVERLATVRVSVSSTGVQASGDSLAPSISVDGRIIAFQSNAINLVSGDANGQDDVFVRNMQTGTTTRVSVGPNGLEGNGHSGLAKVSGDGRFITFASEAFNLVPGGGQGLFIHDRQGGVTSPLAVVGSVKGVFEGPHDAASNDNARYVCFTQPNTSTGILELFVIDRQTQNKSRLDVATSGAAGNSHGSQCAFNDDGTVVAFASTASNLVPGDTNGFGDIFVRVMPGNAHNTATMALDKTALTFAVVASGGAFVTQTAAQSVRLTQSGPGTVTWTATSSQPWLQISPASGTGSATLSLGVVPASGLPASGTVTGTIVISLTNAANTVPPITASVTLLPPGTSLRPFGNVDTPADNRTGVTGAIPFTGWALDDIEVTRISICRDAVGAEVAPIDPNCGGAAGIFVGFAVFIDGARPDVAAAFQLHPLFTRAGWGFMVLTNLLPNQGNGTYRFTMRAQDREGQWFVLGTRTIHCANANATLPFGTLDTPEQGGLPVSGTSFINFGWVLTPLPKTIPIDGSTIRVLIDGVDIGAANYNHARPDIQALFPGFNNTNGAVAFKIFDTTTLTNGLHTISWIVTDNAGATEGIGSRFFAVSNGTAAVTAAAAASMSASRTEIDDAPLEIAPLVGRRGWDLAAPYGRFGAGANGVTVIRSEEVSRVELQLGEGEVTGYLRTAKGLTPLPAGSRLDPATNTFTWAPGVGFVGRYDFVFVHSIDGRAISRREVRIILYPKAL